MKSQLKSLVVLTLESTAEVVFMRALSRLAQNHITSGSAAARLEALLNYRPHSITPSSSSAVRDDLDMLCRLQPDGRPSQPVKLESLTAELLAFTAKQLSARFAEGEGMYVLIDLGPLHLGSDPVALVSGLLGSLTIADREVEH